MGNTITDALREPWKVWLASQRLPLVSTEEALNLQLTEQEREWIIAYDKLWTLSEPFEILQSRAVGTYCQMCGANHGKPHQDEDLNGVIVTVRWSGAEQKHLCQVCDEGMKQLKKDGVLPIPQQPDSLYAAIVAAGIETDHHETDLYFPVTPESTAILERFPLNKSIAKKFRINRPTTIPTWYEVPFAYTPEWDKKRKRHAR